MRDITYDPPSEIDDPKAWLESNACVVVHVVMHVSRRRRLPVQDADELLSRAFAHLVKYDYRVLRAYRGSSSLSTYLTVVVERQLLDMRNETWGKWRPSAAARRQGPAAVRFERLVTRDGFDPAQAQAMTGHRADEALPVAGTRGSRRLVGLELAVEEPASDPDPLEQLLQRQRGTFGARVRRQLAHALRQFDATDRAIIQMRHADGMQIAQIARRLRTDQRPLYARITALHSRLRDLLARGGIGREALGLTGDSAVHVPQVLGSESTAAGRYGPAPLRHVDRELVGRS